MSEFLNLKNWFNVNRKYFSIVLNGFPDPPVLSYLSLLPLIDSSGLILDIGSGNGMLLKFILDFSNHNIIPYGIDKNEIAINKAKRDILPQYSSNFIVAEMDEYIPFKQKFNIIICNPFYSKYGFDSVISRLLGILNKSGKIIVKVHDDVLQKKNIRSLDEEWSNFQIPIKYSRGADVTFGIISG